MGKERERVRGFGMVDRTNVVSTKEILGPCYIQADPVNDTYFWYNHWIDRNAGEDLTDSDNATAP